MVNIFLGDSRQFSLKHKVFCIKWQESEGPHLSWIYLFQSVTCVVQVTWPQEKQGSPAKIHPQLPVVPDEKTALSPGYLPLLPMPKDIPWRERAILLLAALQLDYLKKGNFQRSSPGCYE